MKHRAYNKEPLHNHDLFPELGKTLFFFIEKLHEVLVEAGIEKVYFLSREGQPLKRMFDMYLRRQGKQIDSHYLEVSRRSTLLPSLGSLAEEDFASLFRQYRRISLLEFLSSLGLEAQTRIISEELILPDGAETKREEDFSTCQTFARLKALPLFQHLYDSERIVRRRAFITYLTNLSGGKLPTRLVVVDVGWKGTIQDNLFALLCRRGDTPVREVTGYYIGLVETGSAIFGNDKYGLLFSSSGKTSPKFCIFNENRSLFEIILAADHGSIVSYQSTADGHAHAVRGEFEESEMLTREVFPIQHRLFARFDKLLTSMPTDRKSPLVSFKEVVRGHARMVFNPTSYERRWFSSVFHVENFGLFERSLFSESETRASIVQRLHFLMRLLRKRRTGDLGFWPWKTIYERAGFFPAAIYAAIRRLQR